MSKLDLKGRSFLKLLDFSPEEIEGLLALSERFKRLKRARVPQRICDGLSAALIFEKTSTRTRCAFEVAAAELGMHTTYLDPQSSQLGHKESVADTARVLGCMFDGIEYRGFRQSDVEILASRSGVPVWNGLTDEFHPTQVLADLLTIRERFGRLSGIRLVYMGDAGFNMGNSILAGAALTGMDLVICAPEIELYRPSAQHLAACEAVAAKTGARISFETDPLKAARGADAVYTDVWVSMGEPVEIWQQAVRDLLPYQVNRAVMEAAAPGAVFMHCLPSFHDLNTEIGRNIHELFGIEEMEVTDEVFESPASIVFEEAENRLHTAKAVMAATLTDAEEELDRLGI